MKTTIGHANRATRVIYLKDFILHTQCCAVQNWVGANYLAFNKLHVYL